MNLQRPDAGRQIDEAVGSARLKRRHQRVNAEAQCKIENNGTVLDQKIGIPSAAVDDIRSVAACGERTDNAVVRAKFSRLNSRVDCKGLQLAGPRGADGVQSQRMSGASS